MARVENDGMLARDNGFVGAVGRRLGSFATVTAKESVREANAWSILVFVLMVKVSLVGASGMLSKR